MRILWVGTKPPWPPLDGGRLVAARSIEALTAAGHDVTVLVPSLAGPAAGAPPARLGGYRVVPARPRSWATAVLVSLGGGMPVSISRHSIGPVQRAVAALVVEGRFDVVHAEQVQALPQCEPALRASIPVVLRAQNVESELWAGPASGLPAWIGGREAARLAAFEGVAARKVAAVVAFTPRDAARLRELSARVEGIHCVRPPWPSRLPSGEAALPGSPAVVLLGSPSWRPNQEGASWFATDAWPAVRARLPGARLHVFGLAVSGEGIVSHPAPADSRDAFPEGTILVVPLRSGSGIRVKVLEAWARGVPVVATSVAADGLGAAGPDGLLIAEAPEGFAEAFRRLHEEPGLGGKLVAAGRRRLEADYDPSKVTAALVDVYRSVTGPQA